MTNEQLQVLLMGMLGELSAAIDAAGDAMPKDAEREVHEEIRVKPEYRNDALAYFNPNKKERVEVQGDYVAMLPLTALRDAWIERVGILTKGETTND